jgi:hypothetical protein
MGKFGLDSIVGCAKNQFGTGVLYPTKATLAEAGTITKVTAYTRGYGSTVNMIGFLYADSGVAPTTLLAQSDPVSVSEVIDWVDFTFTLPYDAAAAPYGLGVMGDSSWEYYYKDYGSNNSAYKASQTYPNLPSPFGTNYNDPYQVCIYATYTITGGLQPLVTLVRFH